MPAGRAGRLAAAHRAERDAGQWRRHPEFRAAPEHAAPRGRHRPVLHHPALVAVRRRSGPAQTAGVAAGRQPGRLVRRRSAAGPRRRLGPAGLCRAHPGPRADASAGHPRRAAGRAHRPAPHHPAQPGAGADPEGRGDADAVLAAGHLHDRHGQPCAEKLAAGAPTRTRCGSGAATGGGGVARRRRRRAVAGVAHPAQGQQRRGAHHRPHRTAPGAAARAGGVAPDTAKSRANHHHFTLGRATFGSDLCPADPAAGLCRPAGPGADGGARRAGP